ncbi:hypothetical protein ACFYY1_39195 [Streptomyces sp. NPDC001890]|uniref:hypothetical protein n=1 Tax=Streptomyces sp. NPDC001890 TaxID=3364620 RepID=UPI0036B477D9
MTPVDVPFFPVIVTEHPYLLATGIDPTTVRIAPAEHLADNDLIVGKIIYGTVASILALAHDSEATAITYGEFTPRPLRVTAPHSTPSGLITLTPGLPPVPRKQTFLYTPAPVTDSTHATSPS